MSEGPGGRRLRHAVDSLRAAGHLLEVAREVDPVGEMAAYAVHAQGWPVLFHKVRGARLPVLYNLFGHAHWVAGWMGVPPGGVVQALVDACDMPRSATRVAGAHDLVVEAPVELTAWLPIGCDYQRQTTASIQPAVVFARDPETGHINTSMHILSLARPNQLVVHVQSRHFGEIYGKWQRAGTPMPVAVALGLDPVVWLAFGLNPEHPPAEIEIASALCRGLKMMPCATSDLEVPWATEVLLEGVVRPHHRGQGGREPGPSGVYGPLHRGPIIEVQRLSAFSDAIAHGMVNASRDHLNTLEWLKLAEIVRHLRAAGLADAVRAIKMDPSQADWRSCAIAISREQAGRARDLIDSLLHARLLVGGLRRVIVVDEDVELNDPRSVEWAIATRVRPDLDVITVEVPHGHGRDPITRQGHLVKIGLDATVPPGLEYEYAPIRLAWSGAVDLPPCPPLGSTPPQAVSPDASHTA